LGTELALGSWLRVWTPRRGTDRLPAVCAGTEQKAGWQNVRRNSETITRGRIGSLEFELARKNMRTLRIAVYPPDGVVRVSAPYGMPDAHIESFIQSRLVWIEKQRSRIKSQRREGPHSYADGETLYLRGEPLPLRILPLPAGRSRGRADFNPLAGAIELRAAPSLDPAGREALVWDFYRRALDADVQRLWPGFAGRMGVKPRDFGYRRMKSRWGSCNTRNGHISLNLELEKRPPACLELVLVHELAHLAEASHNARFKAIVAAALPDWKERERQLREWPL